MHPTDCIVCHTATEGTDHIVIQNDDKLQFSRAHKVIHAKCLREVRDRAGVPLVAPYEELLLGPGDDAISMG